MFGIVVPPANRVAPILTIRTNALFRRSQEIFSYPSTVPESWLLTHAEFVHYSRAHLCEWHTPTSVGLDF